MKVSIELTREQIEEACTAYINAITGPSVLFNKWDVVLQLGTTRRDRTIVWRTSKRIRIRMSGSREYRKYS